MRSSASVTTLYSTSATTLSFLYILEGDIEKAEESANEAIRNDRYNARALVNKGICLLRKGEEEEEDEFRKAMKENGGGKSEEEEGGVVDKMSTKYFEKTKELFLESIGVEADCVEAIFNLGIVNMKLGNLVGSRQAFDKLNTILPSQPEVLLNLAYLHQQVLNLLFLS